MTIAILDRNNAPGNIGTLFRRSRPGPETKLVGSFLEGLQVSIPRGCNATVFCEPRIESGFPDLVIVVWNVAVARKWNLERSRLKREDFQLIQYLLHSGPLTYSDLGVRLNRPVSSNLTRLEAANLVFRVGDSWRPRSLAQSFATRHIIAIEAKISAWTKAIRQAFQNTWFASDSLVLLPQRKSLAPVRSAARKLGIKLCSPGTELTYNHTMPSRCLPRSYVSWLFNEWAWRFTLI
jgi:hypothetical protein